MIKKLLRVSTYTRNKTVLGLAAFALVLGSGFAVWAATSSNYGNVIFSDGFESGNTSAWNGNQGNGTITTVAAAAHSGNYGARLVNTGSKYNVLYKALPAAQVDTSTTFWVRVTSSTANGGIIARARNSGSSQSMWELYYNGSAKSLSLFPFRNTTSVEIDTANNVLPLNTWAKIEVRYTATSSGGATLLVNDQTQASWSVSGNYVRTNNYAQLQLWNDSTVSTDFDDVTIAIPSSGPVVPSAPTSVSAAAGNTTATLNWTAPADGGAAITGYRVTPYIGSTAQTPLSTGSTATNYTVNGLTNGTAYTFKIAAINAVGTGTDSAASNAVTPFAPTSPNAPTNVTGTAGNTTVALNWSAPTSNGGSAVTGYQVTPYVGGVAQTSVLTGSTATNYTVTGLTNDTAYTFSVAAINAIGTSSESVQSAALTPTGPKAPVAPTNVTGTAGNTTANLSWTAPSSNGGSAITGYQVTPYIDSVAQTPTLTGSTATNYTVNGLTNGTAYTFTVAATNAIGTSAESAASAVLTPVAPTAPVAPTNVTASAGNATAAINWTAPSSNGGSAVTGYQLTPYIDGVAQNAILTNSTATTFNATGLTNGANYTFTVAAINAVGTSDESSPSNAVTPTAPTAPIAPTNVTGTAGNALVNLNWTAPSSNGGSVVTGYQVTPYVNGVAQTARLTNSTTTSYAVTGLTNGTDYTFTVAAINAIGTGAQSTPSATLSPTAPAGSHASPMPIISRGVPAFGGGCTGTGTCAANDNNYRTTWGGGVGTSLVYNLSSVPAAQRTQIVLAWFNENTSEYNHNLDGMNAPAYGLMNSYTIEGSTAGTGSSAPTSGWTALKDVNTGQNISVTGNHYHSRQHVINFSGYNWIRINVNGSDGNGISLNVDVHNASAGVTDDWIFYGDSITQDGMPHRPIYDPPAGETDKPNWSQIINQNLPSYSPLYEEAGIGGMDTNTLVAHIDEWLAIYPGKYVVMSYGTNDANHTGCSDSVNFRARYKTAIQKVLAAGKVPVIPLMPSSPASGVQACGPTYNNQIKSLYTEFAGQLIPGPDFWSFYQQPAHSGQFADGLHPNREGYAAMQGEWARVMQAAVYN